MRCAAGPAALLVLALGLASRTRAATGPPDGFGYTWANQNEPGVEVTVPTPTTGPFPVTLGNDQVSAPVALGFNFPFYGMAYTRFVISDNGWLSFDTTLTNSSPVALPIPLPSSPNALVAWYWRDLSAPRSVDYYTFTNGLYLKIVTKSTGAPEYDTSVFVILYRSGVIKIVFGAAGDPSAISVGIENAAGTVGHNPWLYGTGKNGFTIADQTAIAFFPAKLNCAAPTPIACGQTVTSTTSGSSNVTDYLCNPDTHLGPERLFRFVNPTYNDVTFSLAGVPPGIDLDLFVLADASSCAEYPCLEGGKDTVIRPFLMPGTYDVVVDGKAASDFGSFSLSATCTPKSDTLTCGQPPVRWSTSGISAWSFYTCGGFLQDGPEMVYQFAVPKPGNYTVNLVPDPGVQLDLLLFGPDRFDPPNGCRQWGDRRLVLFNPPLGTYSFLIDGRTTATEAPIGAFTIQVSCDIFLLECTAPAAPLQCFQETSGTTVGSVNHASQYSCSSDVLDGPEVVLPFHNDARRTVTFAFQGAPGLELLLVPASCDERACAAASAGGRLVAHDLDPGDYFLAVDGKNGAQGAYKITPYCGNAVDPPAGSWSLEAGQTVHESKTAWVSGDLERGDVLFAIDTTKSMAPSLANLQQTANSVIDQLGMAVPDLAFGLVGFEDYPGRFDACGYFETYSGAADLPYRLTLPITDNRAALAGAIASLSLSAGGDSPEAYLRILHEAAADPSVAWRPGARRFLIMIGDDEPHSCDAAACARTRATTGVDPGADGVIGTADDLELGKVLAELKASGIQTQFLFPGNPAKPFLLQDWGCWMGLAGGKAWDAPAGTLPPALVSALQTGIESTTVRCQKLEVRASLGFESWVQNVAPPGVSVGLPAKASFDLDVGPPAGTPAGVYSFTVDIVCDGVVVASQAVTITVSASCIPKPPADAGPNRSVCPGGSTVLGTPGVAGLVYAWAPATELNNPGLAQPAFTATAAPGTRSYTLTVTDPSSGCSATSKVSVDVANTAPAGRVGNALRASKRTSSVRLDWPAGPLAPPVYNVHRLPAKGDILAAPTPPAIGPIANTSGVETYTDVGAIPGGGVGFYQVYGRDCAGSSINN